jgi:hypothetical protein
MGQKRISKRWRQRLVEYVPISQAYFVELERMKLGFGFDVVVIEVEAQNFKDANGECPYTVKELTAEVMLL